MTGNGDELNVWLQHERASYIKVEEKLISWRTDFPPTPIKNSVALFTKINFSR